MDPWNKRLVHALKARDKTPADLARHAGVKPPSVQEWIDGITKNLKAGNAAKACNYLSINLDWLLHKKGLSGLEQDPKSESKKKFLSMVDQMQDPEIDVLIQMAELMGKDKTSTHDAADPAKHQPLESSPRQEKHKKDPTGAAKRINDPSRMLWDGVNRRKKSIPVLHELRKSRKDK